MGGSVRALKYQLLHSFEKKDFRNIQSMVDSDKGIGRFLLAQVYERGNTVVERNLTYAYALYSLAKKQGVKGADKGQARLEEKLSDGEKRKAEELVLKALSNSNN